LKTVYTVHGSYLYLSKNNKNLLISIFRKADYVVFVNKFLYDVIPQDCKAILKNKYFIIFNGVDYNFSFRDIDVRKKYSLSESDRVFFHPARFVPEKNQINLIRAFSQLTKDKDDLKLIFAGDGPLRADIEEEVRQNDLSQSVILLGTINREEVY